MKIIEIVKIINASGRRMLTVNDFSKILNSVNKNTVYKTIERLVANGVIKRLANGLYAVAANPPEGFEIANFLYIPSYVSLESALYRYGVLLSLPFTVSSVTPKKPKRKLVGDSEFEYVHIAPKYFFGYIRDKNTLIATREKAYLDLLYLISKKVRHFDLHNLDFKDIDKKRLTGYLNHYTFPPLINLLKELRI